MRETDGRRRFTIADGMIIIAATALALVAARTRIVNPSMRQSTWAWAVPNLTWIGLAFTLALIPIRYRRPRPDRDDLWRQPGWVACVSVAIALMISLFQQLLSLATIALRRPSLSFRSEFAQIFEETIYRLPFDAVMVVSATWAVLGWGGWWRAEPSWIDRTGRAIGLFWIVLNLVSWCSVLFL